MAFHKKAGHKIEDMEPMDLSQAAQLPRRHRGQHLMPEARLWPDPLHLARADNFKTYVWSSVVAYNLALFIASSRPETGSIWLRPLERPHEEDERHAKRDDDG